MFRSSSCHTIDDKGRLIIPARFRNVLKTEDDYGIMVSIKDGCIFAFTFSEWKAIEDRLKTVKTASMQRFKRFFLGNACPLTCDKQDRVLIPQNLRSYAGINKEVVLVGVLDRFEIWAKDKWEQEQKIMEQEIKQEDVRVEIASIGL
ncbi:division/cell wall cluster transcriptional repressor MraZ [uncultured Desulfobacter sp.]|uniref:division/cell wall cluster transcriptional repressor MraZ n=1 Tax=uncultured Desulfobacter sp. TaxID=240139 RepID=UPI0029C6E26A|nr:division/cell wall cluster transcriptional repressor MraZ [uncultured Desulfobacter sp.]